MKTVLFALLFAFVYATAADPRRPSEAMILAGYESEAIAQARQRPEVIKLRFALAKAATEADRRAISASLYAILEAAAVQGRQAGLAALEQTRREDDDLHRKWDEERRHQELLLIIQQLRR